MVEKIDIVDQVLRDAQKNHFIKVDANDSNMKSLVAYALTVGQSEGYKIAREVWKKCKDCALIKK